jgi:menaquinone-dependent protoporphyrinogen oxidase
MNNNLVDTDAATAAQSAFGPVLILFSSRFGDSKTVAQAVAQRLEHDGITSQLRPLEQAQTVDVHAFSAAVLVASIRYGHFHKSLLAFVARHASWLQETCSGFVSLSLTARKADKRSPQTNAYTRKFLAKARLLGWMPAHCEAVAGALRYPRYHLMDRLCIQLIMRITGGETDASREYEYTDWAQVEGFAAAFGCGLRRKTDLAYATEELPPT